MFHLWDWTNLALCRARTFTTITSTVASATALLILAVVRYRKVCHPLGWQVNSRHARFTAIAVLVASALVSAAIAATYGDQTKPVPDFYTGDAHLHLITTAERGDQSPSGDSLKLLRNSTEIFEEAFDANISHEAERVNLMFNNSIVSPAEMTIRYSTMMVMRRNTDNNRLVVYGHECSTADVYIGTIYPILATGGLFVLFLVLAFSVCILYSLIGRKAWKHRKHFQLQRAANSKTDVSNVGMELKVLGMFGLRRKKEPKHAAKSENATAAFSNTPPSVTNSSSIKNDSVSNEIAQVSLTIPASVSRPVEDTNYPETKVRFTGAKPNDMYDNALSPITIEAGKETELEQKFATEKRHSFEVGVRLQSLKSVNTLHQRDAICKESRQRTDFASSCKNNNRSTNNDTSEALDPHMATSPKISQQSPADSASSKNLFKEPQMPSQQQTLTANSHHFVNIELYSKPTFTTGSLDNLHDSDKSSKTTFDEGTRYKPVSLDLLSNTLDNRSQPEDKAMRPNRQSLFRRRSQLDKNDRPEVLNRTTAMLFCISTIYIVGYLSHLSMMIFKVAAPETFGALGFIGKSLWNFFVRLYYINCAANPVVYSLCDPNFRKNWVTLFKRKEKKKKSKLNP